MCSKLFTARVLADNFKAWLQEAIEGLEAAIKAGKVPTDFKTWEDITDNINPSYWLGSAFDEVYIKPIAAELIKAILLDELYVSED